MNEIDIEKVKTDDLLNVRLDINGKTIYFGEAQMFTTGFHNGNISSVKLHFKDDLIITNKNDYH